MTGFFLNLASRAVGDENAVRPRVAGRFEPAEPAAELAEISEEIARGADTMPIAPDSRQRRRETGTDGLNPAAEPRVPSTPSLSSPPSGASQPINPDADDAQQSSPVILTGPESKPADRDDPQSTVWPTASLQAPNADAAELPQWKETRLVEDDATAHKQLVDSRPAPPVAIPGSTAASPANAPVVNATVGPHPATGMLARETFVARKPRGMPGPANALPPPETIVHVTIGRVELRAPAAAAPRKREQAVSQAGTLAEYLQKHAARRRS